MPVLKNVSIFVKKLPLNTFAWLIAVAIGAFGLYATLHEPKPMVSLEIIGESNVLDVYRPLEDLDVSFRGQDIQKSNQNLRILTVRVENTGDTDIRQVDFDQTEAWGLYLKNGQVIRTKLVGSNVAYIQNNLNPRLASKDSVIFDKIIFDRRKYFTLEILVLHGKGVQPQIIPIGKIAGIDSISVQEYVLKEPKPSFIKQTYQGSWAVQVLRTLSYTIGLILLVVIMVFISDKADVFEERRHIKLRKEILKRVVSGRKLTEGSVSEHLLEIYKKGGINALKGALSILDDKKSLLLDLTKYQWEQDHKEELKDLQESYTYEIDDVIFYSRHDPDLLARLLKSGVVRLAETAEVEVDEEKRDKLNELVEMIEEKESAQVESK